MKNQKIAIQHTGIAHDIITLWLVYNAASEEAAKIYAEGGNAYVVYSNGSFCWTTKPMPDDKIMASYVHTDPDDPDNLYGDDIYDSENDRLLSFTLWYGYHNAPECND